MCILYHSLASRKRLSSWGVSIWIFNHLSPANAYAHYEPTISNHNTILTQKPAEYRAGHDLKSLEWTDQMPVQWIQSKQSLFCSIAHSILELWFNGTIGISSMHGDKSKWTHCKHPDTSGNQLSYNCSIYRYRPNGCAVFIRYDDLKQAPLATKNLSITPFRKADFPAGCSSMVAGQGGEVEIGGEWNLGPAFGTPSVLWVFKHQLPSFRPRIPQISRGSTAHAPVELAECGIGFQPPCSSLRNLFQAVDKIIRGTSKKLEIMNFKCIVQKILQDSVRNSKVR